MTRPTVIIHNVETNEIVEREMTLTEFKDYEVAQTAGIVEQEALAEKAKARAAILDRLGLTDEEAKILLG